MSGGLSQFSREQLEETIVKNARIIKRLVKEKEELNAIIEENNKKNSNNTVNKSSDEINTRKTVDYLGNFGKTITSMISHKKSELTIENNQNIVNIDPQLVSDDNIEDSPIVKAIKMENVSCKNKLMELTEKISTLQMQIDLQNVKMEAKQSENSNLENQIKVLRNENAQYSDQIHMLRNKLDSVIQSNISETNEYKATEQVNCDLKDENMKLRQENIQFRVDLEEEQRQVDHLRLMLTKSMDNEQDMSDKIRSLTFQLSEYESQVELLNNFISKKKNKIKEIKAENSELKAKLSKTSDNAELEVKIKKMSKMVEKSNLLYAEMCEKHDKMEKKAQDLENQLKSKGKDGKPIIRFCGPKSSYTLFDNGNFLENIPVENVQSIRYGDYDSNDIETQTKSETSSNEYIQQLTKRYLLSNEKSRKDIEPILFQLFEISESSNKVNPPGKKSFLW